MKVYIVESLECDYDTNYIREGVFDSLEKAEKFIFKKFSNLSGGRPLFPKYMKHLYSTVEGENMIAITIEGVDVL